jgi:hypothetical protein
LPAIDEGVFVSVKLKIVGNFFAIDLKGFCCENNFLDPSMMTLTSSICRTFIKFNEKYFEDLINYENDARFLQL